MVCLLLSPGPHLLRPLPLVQTNPASLLSLQSAKQSQAWGVLNLLSLLRKLSQYSSPVASRWYHWVSAQTWSYHSALLPTHPPLLLFIPLNLSSFPPGHLLTLPIINVFIHPAFPTVIYRSYKKAMTLSLIFPAVSPTSSQSKCSVTN